MWEDTEKSDKDISSHFYSFFVLPVYYLSEALVSSRANNGEPPFRKTKAAKLSFSQSKKLGLFSSQSTKREEKKSTQL